MSSLIHDVLNDPREYSPFLLMLGGLLLLWGALCLSGFVSIRAGTRRRRFWFALPPLLFGVVCVLAEIPMSIGHPGSELNVDLRWLFIVPLLFGVAGLVLWWRARHETVA